MRKYFFFGSTAQCMENFASSLPKNPLERSKKQKGMIEATGVKQPAVHAWCVGKYLPTGVTLIKLRHYLDSMGYAVTELDNLNKTVLKVAELVATDTLTIEELASELGLSSHSHVRAWLVGGENPAANQLEALRKIVQRNCPNEVESQAEPNLNSSLGTMLKGGLMVIKPLIEMAITKLTPEQRQELRQSIGSKELFQTSTLLNAICSEKSLEQFNNNQNRGNCNGRKN